MEEKKRIFTIVPMAFESFFGGTKVHFHEHLVYPTNISSLCDACHNSEERVGGEAAYICRPCNLYVHKDCVEINNTYRHKHPLKLLMFDYLFDIGKTCYLCGKKIGGLFYHCFLCDLTYCTVCPSEPLVIDDVPEKIHEHRVTQMMIKVSFTCDACGIFGDGLPCVCLRCCFIIHRDCIKLPRLITINRHDHRVAYTNSLGPGDWMCGVCRKGIDRNRGAYSCSRCRCRYAAHSKCATRENVWDGVEQENVAEDEENLYPFEVIEEGVIKYFSHEHHLTSLIAGNYENRYCYACTQPIDCDPCYTCTCKQCRFILHQTCANLPRKERHEVSIHQFTLCDSPAEEEDYSYYHDGNIAYSCHACNRPCTGFCYKNEYVIIDVRCAQVTQTFNHGSHPHPLFSDPAVEPNTNYFNNDELKACKGCGDSYKPVMSCTESDCDFLLCYYCATLPKEVKHKYDLHPLSLCYGKNAEGLYWCEICERKTNPKEWFYTCNDCGSTLHVNCVLGDYLHVRPGHSFIVNGVEFEDEDGKEFEVEFEVVANNRPTRPFCSYCEKRCVQPFFFKSGDDEYLCCYSCMRIYKAMIVSNSRI